MISTPRSRRQRCKRSLWIAAAAMVLFTTFSSSVAENYPGGDQKVCSASSSDPNCAANKSYLPPDGRSLRPSDLPPPVVFTDFLKNFTITLTSGVEQSVASGKVKQINNFDNPSRNDVMADFAVLPQAVDRPAIEELLSLLAAYKDWDDDPDTVDGMISREVFVKSPDMNTKGSIKYRDTDPKFAPARKQLREELMNVMQPYIDNVITPMVLARYSDACTAKGPSRTCTPCYSLVRNYRHGQRQSHATHHDGHALVTVVMSLSDYNVNYRGGLYVSSRFGHHEFLALNKGDAVMHQSSLLHGVQVHDVEDDPESTERWSWIIWYKDSTNCDADYGYEWFSECASKGDALCQKLHSTKVGQIPGISNEEATKQTLQLSLDAADGGSAGSAVKIARAYLGLLPSALPRSVELATEYYQKAVDSNNPDGHFGMALVLLMSVTNYYIKSDKETFAWADERVGKAVEHLEKAAYFGHAYAKFNLGVVHTFGYDQGKVDFKLAGQWFEASGLPEGYFIAAQQAMAVGNKERENKMMEIARATGYFEPWRKQARQSTGSGGAGGVDLNLPWPPSFEQRLPPKF